MKYADLYFSINYHTIKLNELKIYTSNNPSLMIQIALWNTIMP